MPGSTNVRRVGLGPLLLLTVVSQVGLGLAVWRAGPDPDPRIYPSGWQLGGLQAEPLGELLARVDRLLPRGATLVVDSLVYEGDERTYLLAWCGYLLPRHRVVLAPFELDPEDPLPSYRLVVPAPRAEIRVPAGQERILHEAAGSLMRFVKVENVPPEAP